jgi:predicted nuclease of predicted toxin-antitoxin system
LRLLVDECAAAKPLVRRLRDAGHDVVTSVEVLGNGASDAAVFDVAKRQRRTILTRDCTDFLALHAADSKHYGLLLIYEDGDARDLTFAEIAAAVPQAARSAKTLKGRCVILNRYRSP